MALMGLVGAMLFVSGGCQCPTPVVSHCLANPYYGARHLRVGSPASAPVALLCRFEPRESSIRHVVSPICLTFDAAGAWQIMPNAWDVGEREVVKCDGVTLGKMLARARCNAFGMSTNVVTTYSLVFFFADAAPEAFQVSATSFRDILSDVDSDDEMAARLEEFYMSSQRQARGADRGPGSLSVKVTREHDASPGWAEEIHSTFSGHFPGLQDLPVRSPIAISIHTETNSVPGLDGKLLVSSDAKMSALISVIEDGTFFCRIEEHRVPAVCLKQVAERCRQARWLVGGAGRPVWVTFWFDDGPVVTSPTCVMPQEILQLIENASASGPLLNTWSDRKDRETVSREFEYHQWR